MAGRPTKFTPEVREIILETIEEGNYLKVACECAGVSYKVFKDWMNRGLSEDPEHAEYRAFHSAVKRAVATAERNTIKRISVASLETWQAAAWLAERRFGERWRQKKGEPPPVASTAPVKVEVEVKYVDAEPPDTD